MMSKSSASCDRCGQSSTTPLWETRVQLFSSHQLFPGVLKPTQMNCTAGLIAPGFGSAALNTTGATASSVWASRGARVPLQDCQWRISAFVKIQFFFYCFLIVKPNPSLQMAGLLGIAQVHHLWCAAPPSVLHRMKQPDLLLLLLQLYRFLFPLPLFFSTVPPSVMAAAWANKHARALGEPDGMLWACLLLSLPCRGKFS